MNSKMTRSITAVFLMVLSVGICQKAYAYTPGACREDAAKMCPGAMEKEVIPCLKTHENELSTPCKVNLAEAREVVREMKDACQSDLAKFCADVKQGQGRIRRCLKAHEAELTSECKASVTAARQKYQIAPSTTVPSQTVTTPEVK